MNRENDEIRRGPFDAVETLFPFNGQSHLRPHDSLRFMVESLSWWIDPQLHQSLQETLVNQKDVTSLDDDGRSTPIRVMSVKTIRTRHPEVDALRAAVWLHYETQRQLDAFETYCQSGLSASTQSHVRVEVQRVCDTHELYSPQLQARIGNQDVLAQLRADIDRVRPKLVMLTAAQISASLPGLLNTIRSGCDRAAADDVERARRVRDQLITAIGTDIDAAHAARAQDRFAVYQGIAAHLGAVAETARQESGTLAKQLQEMNGRMKMLLDSLQKGWWRPGARDQHAREAGHHVCDTLKAAVTVRRKHNTLETLAKLLNGGLFDLHGNPLLALRAAFPYGDEAEIERIRTRLVQLRAWVATEKLTLRQHLERNVSFFTPTLLDEEVAAEQVETRTLHWCAAREGALPPPVASYLSERLSLTETLQQLPRFLPDAARRTRSFTELVQQEDEPMYRERFLEYIRAAKEEECWFTPLDPTVLWQEGIRLDGEERRGVIRLTVPGGREGYAGRLCIAAHLVKTEEILDSGRDEARFVRIIDGLPYYALRPIRDYEGIYRRYCQRLGRISPHTFRHGHRFPSLEPPRTSLQLRCERIVALTPELLSQRLQRREDNSYTLLTTTMEGKSTPPEIFPEPETLVVWLSQYPAVRRELQRELEQVRRTDPSRYFAGVRRAVPQVSGQIRALLEDELRQVTVSSPPAPEDQTPHINGMTTWEPTRTDT